MKDNDFVHTHVHTEFSLLDGYSRIKPLAEEAKRLGQRALAITDHGNMHGVPDFYDACNAVGIQPIIGMEGYIVDDVNVREGRTADYNHLLLFAQNQEGYQNLLKLVTRSHVEGFWRKPRIDKAMLAKHSSGLIVTSGCLAGEIPEMIQAKSSDEDIARVFAWYKEVFDDCFYAEIQNHEEPDSPQAMVNVEIIRLAKHFGVKLLATNDLHYVSQEDAEAQDVMLCVQMGKDLSDTKRMKFGSENYYLKSADQMSDLFYDMPDALSNTVELAERCGGIVLPRGQDLMPTYRAPSGYDSDADYLYHLCEDGLRWRYGEIASDVRARLNREFEVIRSKGFVSYFLIVWDYVNFARGRGMRCVARGSVAGSVIAYALGISNIDPLRYNIMFERFLNPERNAMPDIDIDFPDDRREEVVRYIADTYGWDKVAQIVTFNTMASKAAVRDVARVLNLRSEGDAISRALPPNTPLQVAMDTAPDLIRLLEMAPKEGEQENPYQRIVDKALALEGTVRNTGVHAAGVVISNTPLVELTPCQPRDRKASDGWLITQYGQHHLEEMGLLKMDCLGLSNLSILQRAVKLIKEHKGVPLDIDTIPVDDSDAFALLAAGETTGVFQFESANMRGYLRELKPTRLEDITAMVALYRPGPMDSIPRYIRAKHGGEVTYPHPLLENILRETYGVLVYQDQVLLTAVELAGFTWGEVDKFRKAIGKKIRAELLAYREKFINGCETNGITRTKAIEIFDLIEPFGGYGFNKAHAASYALVAYQTAYLKAHYPAEFFAASLTAEAGDPKKVSAILADCMKRGISVLQPDINKSARDFTVEQTSVGSDAVRFGLSAVKNLGEKAVANLLAARGVGGPFRSVADVFARTYRFSTGYAAALAKAGALDCFSENRASLLAAIPASAKYGRDWRDGKRDNLAWHDGKRDDSKYPEDELPDVPPQTPRDRLHAEYEMLGFYVSGHPLKEYEAQIRALETRDSISLSGDDDCQQVRIVGRVSEVKTLKTKAGDHMARAVIEDLTGAIDVVVFAATYAKTKLYWRPGALVVIDGEFRYNEDQQQIFVKHAEKFTPEKKKTVAEVVEKKQVLTIVVPDIVHDDPSRKAGVNTKLMLAAGKILGDYVGDMPYVIVDRRNMPQGSSERSKKYVAVGDELLGKLTTLGVTAEVVTQ